MRIVPKFLSGGSYSEYFTVYNPISQRVSPSSGSSSSKSSSGSSSKGELTEKDLFNMIKDIDGLPNEMNEIVSNLIKTLRVQSIEGVSTEDLATTYLKNLYQIKVAALNKEKYDTAIKAALENGSMSEPAIDTNGNLYVLYNDGENKGKITTVSPEEYFKNKGNYSILTTSNLANMRAYDMRLSGDLHIFNVIENNMGYEAFLELLDKAKILLGHTTTNNSITYGNQALALAGLLAIEGMTEELKLLAILAVLNGYTGESTKVKSNAEQIKAYVNYLVTVLPQRARTWAMIKTSKNNWAEATATLVYDYLLGRSELETSHTINYKTGKTSNGSGTSENGLYDGIELNASMKWLAGYGNLKQFTINPETSKLYIVLANALPLTNKEKKYVGVNSTLQEVSSGDYAGILDFNNASIGGNIVNTVNFGLVVIRDGNIYSVDLPYDVERYNKTGEIVPLIKENLLQAKKQADQEIKSAGIDLTKQSSIKLNVNKINEIYRKYSLGNIYDSNGSPILGWKRFGVINVYASNKVIGGKRRELRASELLHEVTDDNIILNLLNITGDKHFDEKSLAPGDWFGWYDSFCEGTLYIPIDSSYIAASANISMDLQEVKSLNIGDQSLLNSVDLEQVYKPE